MTKTCTKCGVTATGQGQIIKEFVKSSGYKYGIEATCKRCHNLGKTANDVVGPYSLLTEKPSPKVCACCGKESYVYGRDFRHVRSTRASSSAYLPICKGCEQVACLVLGEFQHLIREGKHLEGGPEDPWYKELLSAFYLMTLGHIPDRDVLSFPARYALPNGTPCVRSAKRIWQIKLDVGYSQKEIVDESGF